jgi:hypothetical protein
LEAPQEVATAKAGPTLAGPTSAKAGPTGYSRTEHRL